MFATNAQGNYDQGRGPDGLNAIDVGGTLYGSRFGAGTRTANRPANVGGRSYARAGTLALELARRVHVSFPGVKTQPGVTIRRVSRRRILNRAQKMRDRKKFLNWIQRWAPRLHADAKARADRVERSEGTLGGLGSWWDTFMDSVGSLGGKYVQFRTQKEILDAQMERMRQGLPPLETSEYAPTIAVKPDPGTTREITGAIGAGFGSLLPWLAVGGVGLYLLTRRK